MSKNISSSRSNKSIHQLANDFINGLEESPEVLSMLKSAFYAGAEAAEGLASIEHNNALSKALEIIHKCRVDCRSFERWWEMYWKIEEEIQAAKK